MAKHPSIHPTLGRACFLFASFGAMIGYMWNQSFGVRRCRDASAHLWQKEGGKTCKTVKTAGIGRGGAPHKFHRISNNARQNCNFKCPKNCEHVDTFGVRRRLVYTNQFLGNVGSSRKARTSHDLHVQPCIATSAARA